MKKKIWLLIILASLNCEGAEKTEISALDSLEGSINIDQESKEENSVLLRMQERHNDQILDTIYWFMGTTTALFAVMLGFGWFSSLRDNRKNQEALKKLIEDEMKDKKNELDKILNNFSEENKLQLKEIEKKITGRLSEELSLQNERVENEIFYMKYSIDELDFENWVGKEVYSNAFRCAKQMLSNSIEADKKYFQSRALERIYDLVKNPECKLRLDADEARGIIEIMGGLDSSHIVIKDVIVRAISGSR